MGVKFAPCKPGLFVCWSIILGLATGLVAIQPAAGTPLPPGPKPTALRPTATAGTSPASTQRSQSQSAARAAPEAGAAAVTFKMLTCGASDSSFTTLSSALVVVRSCTLNVPEAGVVYLAASSSVAATSNSFGYTVRTNLSIDTTAGDSATDRFVTIFPLSGEGTDKSTSTSLLAPLGPGSHTFYYLAARASGIGTVTLLDSTLSALYVPASATDVQTCGAASALAWTTSESVNFQAISSCTLAVPADGVAFISAGGSARVLDTSFEGRFRVGVDSVVGTAASDRWLNSYAGLGGSSEDTVATSLLVPLAAGTHTFYFSGYRYAGSGTLQVLDPALSVLYFRAPNTTARICGSSGQETWTNATTSFTTLRACSLEVPSASTAFIDASGSAGLNASGASNEWKGLFRIGVDSAGGSSATDRRLHVLADAGDGTDRPVADSLLAQVAAGARTFSFVGRRFAGSGTLRVYSPALTVIVPLPQAPAPPTSTPAPPTPAATGAPPLSTPTAGLPVAPTPTALPTTARRTILLPFVQR